MRTEHELFMEALILLDNLCALGCMTEEEEATLDSIEQTYFTWYARLYENEDDE